MKSIIKSTAASLLVILAMSFLVSAMAKPKSENVKFQSTPVCTMCKSKIETALQKVDGVLASLVNLNNGKISIKFDPAITNAEHLKSSVLNLGYSVNGTQPNKESYDKLPDCCKGKTKH
jgi:copper chaperone CopZ